MKKNLISVIILALCLANLVLSALLIFTVLPQTKQANALIEKVCTAIDLDLNSGGATSAGSVPLDEQEIYAVKDGADITVTLSPGADGDSHYLVLGLTISLNKNSANYSEESQAKLKAQDSIIVSVIQDVVGKYTVDNALSSKEQINNEILTELQELLGQDYIIRINISNFLVS